MLNTRTPTRYRAFDAFLAGASAFVAGIFLTLALTRYGWTRQDGVYIGLGIAGLAYAWRLLRGLYLAQAA